jgi:hypothetical protein
LVSALGADDYRTGWLVELGLTVPEKGREYMTWRTGITVRSPGPKISRPVSARTYSGRPAGHRACRWPPQGELFGVGVILAVDLAGESGSQPVVIS